MIAWLALPATAGVDAFVGRWALDPFRSDDPTQQIDRAFSGPLLTGGAARGYSPDGGEMDWDAERTRLLTETLGLLATSATLELAPDDEGLRLVWTGADAAHLTIGSRRWTRIRPADGPTWRLRVREDGDRLRVERRLHATAVTETWLPPERPDELVVVVRVDGSSLEPGVEFRRIYRALHETSP